MIRPCLILLLCLAAALAFGQDQENLIQGDSTIRLKTDSINRRFKNEHARLDSAEERLAHFYDSTRQPRALDSLREAFTTRHRQLDSLQSGYQSKLQSISQLKLPPGKANQRIDSLNRAQENILTKINDSVAKWEDEAKEKWNAKKDKLLGKLKPGKDSLGVDLGQKELSPGLPGVEGASLQKLDDVDIETGVEAPGLDTKALNIPEVNVDNPISDITDPLKEITSAPKEELNELTNIEELNQAKGTLAEAKEINTDLGDYQEGLSDLKEGKDAKKLTEKTEGEALGRVEEFKELDKNAKKIEALRAEREKQLKLIEQYRDKDFIRKQMEEKSKNISNDKLLEQQGKLKEATANLGKYKKKYSEIQSIHDLPKRPPNPMKGKPVRERLFPGAVFQIQKSNILEVYISPQVSYKFNKRLAAGAGALVRLRGTVNDSLRYISENMIYGLKAFSTFTVYKGFGLRAEYEPLRVPLPLDQKANSSFKQWVNGYLLGIDKNFSVNRTWKGNMQVLYNLGYEEGLTPYANKINFRFGFFLDMRRKQKLPGM